MSTGTEFISEISAATVFTSFNFHIFRFSSFRFSGKGEVDVYRMCMCICSLLSRSLVTVSGHLATRKFRHNQLATEKPSRHQPTRRQIKSSRRISCSNESKVVEMKKLFKRSSLACLYACKLHVVGDVI